MPLHANSRKVIIMNAVEITIIVVAAVLLLCGILFGVVSYLVFYEVIARNSKIPGKIDANAKKKMMETNPEKFLLDPREEWLNEQTFENYSITNVDGNKLKGYLLKADKLRMSMSSVATAIAAGASASSDSWRSSITISASMSLSSTIRRTARARANISASARMSRAMPCNGSNS